ncbi:MAG: FlgD immunoglobulin-like domain containing protein [Gemmatimonadota bacterium]
MRRMAAGSSWVLVGAALAVAGYPDRAPGQAYRLRADRVEVSTRAQWQAWQAPAGLAQVSATGVVTPVYIAASENATLTAGSYTYVIPGNVRNLYDAAYTEGSVVKTIGGIKKAGSSTATAPRLMDGDSTTYWEPGAADAVESWWAEIDLGRLVSATRLVVRFAEDSPTDRADPFLQFRVYSSDGQSAFGSGDLSGALSYALVGGTTRPNKDQRVFEFDLTPLSTHSSEWSGRVLQYVRLAATDSDGDMAEQVPSEVYGVLGAQDRGAVQYVWKIGGEERLVTAQRYAELPPEQQGGVRYWRHERPKVAEVEVWTSGVNVGLGILARGGTLTDPNKTAFPERAFDGRIATSWDAAVYSTVGDIADWGRLTVDLGALFRLREVRPITGALTGYTTPLYGYELRGSDGSRAPDGSLIWQALSNENRLLNQGTRLFADSFDPRNIRYLEFRNLDLARRTRADEGHRYLSTVSEMQIYASGYLPELVMSSGFVDMQQARGLTTLQWDAVTPEGTAVAVRTRTGDELREQTRYFNAQGQELLDKAAYDRLPSFAKGQILTEVLAGQGWSGWSQTYLRSGEPVQSPSPRRYMEIEVRLLSSEAAAAAALNALTVSFVDPVAENVVAEINPKRDVALGEPVDFEVYVLPRYGASNPRVDRVRLVAPSLAAMELEGIARGQAAAFAAGTAAQYRRQADGSFADNGGRVAAVAGEMTDSLEVTLPSLLGNGELVRLSFRASVYQSGSTFLAAVGNAGRPGVWQRADGGDAVSDELAKGAGMTVLTPLGGGNIRTFAVTPPVLTPNGDLINDEAVFHFAVLRINGERPVTVAIHDLAGRPVRQLTQIRSQATGMYAIAWDGTDESGKVVPPGAYVARIDVDADGPGGGAATRLVYVAY